MIKCGCVSFVDGSCLLGECLFVFACWDVAHVTALAVCLLFFFMVNDDDDDDDGTCDFVLDVRIRKGSLRSLGFEFAAKFQRWTEIWRFVFLFSCKFWFSFCTIKFLYIDCDNEKKNGNKLTLTGYFLLSTG